MLKENCIAGMGTLMGNEQWGNELLSLAILMKEMFLHWHDWAHRCRRSDETIG